MIPLTDVCLCRLDMQIVGESAQIWGNMLSYEDTGHTELWTPGKITVQSVAVLEQAGYFRRAEQQDGYMWEKQLLYTLTPLMSLYGRASRQCQTKTRFQSLNRLQRSSAEQNIQ